MCRGVCSNGATGYHVGTIYDFYNAAGVNEYGEEQPRAMLSFYTAIGCHRLLLRRDLHSSLGVIAVMFLKSK